MFKNFCRPSPSRSQTLAPARKFTTLKDVHDETSIEDLTIKQLKEILTANFVDYKGCVEKRELTERVRRLWDESQKNRQRGKSRRIMQSFKGQCETNSRKAIERCVVQNHKMSRENN